MPPPDSNRSESDALSPTLNANTKAKLDANAARGKPPPNHEFDKDGNIVSNHPRAKELRKRILARREERLGISSEHETSEEKKSMSEEDAKYLPFLLKKDSGAKKPSKKLLDAEKKHHGQMLLSLASYNNENRKFLSAVSQQYTVSNTLSTLRKDLDHTGGRGREKIDAVSTYEKRLMNLKKIIKDGPPKTHDADKDVDNGIRSAFSKDVKQEFGRCLKCNEKFVKHLLLSHSLYCSAVGDDNVADDEEAEKKAKENDEASLASAIQGANMEEVFCPLCGKKFTSKTITKHQKKCEERAKFLGEKEGAEGSLISLMAPQKPRKIEVGLVNHDSIQLKWEPPILDGGCKVYEYEINYKKCVVQRIGKRETREYEAMPAIVTSRYVKRHAVATYGFTIENLSGETEYSDIVIRCRNKIDWGPFSAPLDPVTTKKFKPPTMPLYFENIKLTSSVIAFKWSEPFNCGGAPVVNYILTYTEVSLKDEQGVGVKTDSEKYEEIDHVIDLEGPQTYHSMIDLRGETEFKNFELRAISAAGLESEVVKHPSLVTLESTRRQLLQKEIQRVRRTEGDYIDTDFHQGFVQREEKLDYLGRLEAELHELPEEEVDGDIFGGDKAGAKKKWNKLKFGAQFTRGVGGKVDEHHNMTDDEIYESMQPGFIRRKKQFLYRIETLEKEIEECEQRKVDAVSNRSYLTYQMGHMQERIIALQGEMDRASTFKGEDINSDVIHGTDQRFTVQKLIEDLTVELENAQGSIAGWKNEIIQGDRLKATMSNLKLKKIESLKIRRAAYKNFENQAKRTEKFHGQFAADPLMMKQQFFERWADNAATRVRVRNVMMKVWGDQSTRYLNAALHKWKYGKHAEEQGNLEDKYKVIGAGGKMLIHSERNRLENIKDMADVLVTLTEIGKETTLGKYSNKQRRELEGNIHFHESELGHTLGSYSRDLAHLIQGDAFFNIRKYVEADRCFDKQLQQMRSEDDPENPDVKVLALIYGRKGRVQLAMRNWDRAILNYDRQRSLAEEIESDVEWAAAFMGLGEGYLGKGDYDNSRVLFEQAMLKCIVIGDKVRQARSYRGIQVSYERMYNVMYAQRFKEKADMLTSELKVRMEGAYTSMEDLKARLIDTTASMGEVIMLERITAGCIRMRADRIKLEEKIELTIEKYHEQKKEFDAIEKLLVQIEEQLQEAKTTDKDEMSSALVHEKEQVFEVEELKMRLTEKLKKVKVETEEQRSRTKQQQMNIKNLEDDLAEMDKDLAIEQGPLMQKVMQQRILRCISLNPSNTAGNEVTGTATGGIEFVAAAETKNINIYDIHSGELKLVFSGDEVGRHVGEPEGHTGVITAMIFHDARIYTGSMDTTVMCWDIETEERLFVCQGHEATVTCINVDAYKLITGAADTKIIIWDKDTGEMIKLVHGHSRGVNCIHSGPTWFASGGTEGEIRVWGNLHPKDDPKYKTVKCMNRLKGHGCKVTVIRYGQLELISGDAHGYVIVWWLKTGDIVQKSKAHDGVVTDLQFDATKIVTCGVDNNLQLIDITTGDVLQTLRGHTGPVIGLAFDTTQILSASSDGTLRHWEWGSASNKPDKYHTFESGDNLAKISRKYKVPIPDLVKWNGIKDVKKIYSGQKLIVAKGRPDEPTEAELLASTLKSKERVREAAVQEKIEKYMKMAEEELKKANNKQISSNLKVGNHVSKSSLASRVLHGTGSLLPHEYMKVTPEKEKRDAAQEFVSLKARMKNMGRTKDQLAVKESNKALWETQVQKDDYVPNRLKIGQDVGIFLFDGIVEEFIKDICKECTSTELYDESLSGKFYNFTPRLGRAAKAPIYKLRMRYSNALDFAKGIDTNDSSLGSMGRIDRSPEADDRSLSTISTKASRRSSNSSPTRSLLSPSMGLAEEGSVEKFGSIMEGNEDGEGWEETEEERKKRIKKEKKILKKEKKRLAALELERQEEVILDSNAPKSPSRYATKEAEFKERALAKERERERESESTQKSPSKYATKEAEFKARADALKKHAAKHGEVKARTEELSPMRKEKKMVVKKGEMKTGEE